MPCPHSSRQTARRQVVRPILKSGNPGATAQSSAGRLTRRNWTNNLCPGPRSAVLRRHHTRRRRKFAGQRSDRGRKGCELDTVLGLSMTPTAVGLVLVEGHGADGDIMDQVAFDVPTRRGATAISTSEYVAGAMARTRELANGHRPHAIGVTFSDDFELEASMLLTSLTDAGFDNIVAVRSPEASEALARGIGRTVGYQQIAVCLLEPGSVVVSMVDTRDDAVQSVAHHQHGSAQDLIGWLTDVFDANDWHPQCLIIVGPDADLSRL